MKKGVSYTPRKIYIEILSYLKRLTVNSYQKVGQNINILQRMPPALTHPEHLSSPLDFSFMWSVLYIIVCPFFLFFKLYLSSFKPFLQQMADSRQNQCTLISILFTVTLVPLLVFFVIESPQCGRSWVPAPVRSNHRL